MSVDGVWGETPASQLAEQPSIVADAALSQLVHLISLVAARTGPEFVAKQERRCELVVSDRVSDDAPMRVHVRGGDAGVIAF